MKLGIMQPYFFPYLGYFDLIAQADKWVIFDTPKYIRHGWMNRNRILHPNSGWQYVTVPLKKHSLETPIHDIEALPISDWKPRILGQLMHYKKRAPFFNQTMALVEECFDSDDVNLSRLNTRILGKICMALDIPWKHEVFSLMNLDIGDVDGPGDWALRICEAMNATEYINPPGGEALFDKAQFIKCGIQLTIQQPFEYKYECRGYTPESNLSIIDVLMWNTKAEIRKRLNADRTRQGS